jgi:hypothetical protein
MTLHASHLQSDSDYYVHHKALGLVMVTKNKLCANLKASGYTPGTCVIEKAQPIGVTEVNPFGGIDLSYTGDITGFKSIE